MSGSNGRDTPGIVCIPVSAGRRVDAPVDAVEVTVLVDNIMDILLATTAVGRRPPTTDDWPDRLRLRAEHGYSLSSPHRRGGAGRR